MFSKVVVPILLTCMWKNPMMVLGETNEELWNVLSCTDVCSDVPLWHEAIQLKASNYNDLSLADYFGNYGFFYGWDEWIWENLKVVMCDENGDYCAGYAKMYETLSLNQHDHRFDIRLYECFPRRTTVVRIEIGELSFPDFEVLNEGCFLSVMVNRNPYLHAYLLQQENPDITAVEIAQLLHGQYHLCASQTVEILTWLHFDFRSVAVALANVYSTSESQIVNLLRCAEATVETAAEILKSVYLLSRDDAEEALTAGNYTGVAEALDAVYTMTTQLA